MFADDCSRGNMVMREDQVLGIFLGESTTCLFRYIVKAEHEAAIFCCHLKIRTESLNTWLTVKASIRLNDKDTEFMLLKILKLLTAFFFTGCLK